MEGTSSRPIAACTVLCVVVIALQLYFQPIRHANNNSSQGGEEPGDSAVLRFIQQAANATASSSSSSSPWPGPAEQGPWNDAHGRASCQPSRQALLGIAAAARGFSTIDVGGPPVQDTAGSTKQASLLADLLRKQLAKRWVAALRPLAPHAASKLKSTAIGANAGCRSIHIPPLGALIGSGHGGGSSSGNGARDGPATSTTLLLVLNSWGRLEQQLQGLSLSLFMVWAYASMHGYDLHIYVHGAELPPWMPVYFIKPPGISHMLRDWGYVHVAYLDWDVLISPHSAPPLSLFYGEYPAASLLQQGEYNLCAGVNLWRNTPAAAALLRAWWELGYAGCCPTTQHDQSALKHLVAAYLANFTGQADLYGHKQQAHFALPPVHPATAAAAAAAAGQPAASAQDWQRTVYSTESPPQSVSAYLRIRPQLQQRGSAIGLVGLDAHYPGPGRSNPQQPRVVLTSCMGIWWGCVPADAPALLYHVGHVYAVEWPEWLVPRLLGFLRDWGSVVTDLMGGDGARQRWR